MYKCVCVRVCVRTRALVCTRPKKAGDGRDEGTRRRSTRCRREDRSIPPRGSLVSAQGAAEFSFTLSQFELGSVSGSIFSATLDEHLSVPSCQRGQQPGTSPSEGSCFQCTWYTPAPPPPAVGEQRTGQAQPPTNNKTYTSSSTRAARRPQGAVLAGVCRASFEVTV